MSTSSSHSKITTDVETRLEAAVDIYYTSGIQSTIHAGTYSSFIH